MVQVIPREPGLGELLGSGLGGGFNTTVNALMEAKMKSLMKQEEMKSLTKALGIEQLGTLSSGQPPIATGQEMVSPQSNLSQTLNPQEEQIEKIATNPQAMLALTTLDPNAGKMVETMYSSQLKRQELGEKRAEAQKGREFDLIKDYSKKIQENVSNLGTKQTSLNQLKEAFGSGNLGAFSPDYLADLTGIEAFRSPKGAQAITAGKEFFLGNLSRIKARGVNQWIERQLKEMQPLIGRSRTANLTTTAMLQNEIDLQKKESELFDKYMDMADQGKISYRKVPSSVSKELELFAIKSEAELKKEIQRIQKDYGSASKSTKGQISSSFEKLPNAKDFIGKKIKDNKTGKTYSSDGTSWKEEQ